MEYNWFCKTLNPKTGYTHQSRIFVIYAFYLEYKVGKKCLISNDEEMMTAINVRE